MGDYTKATDVTGLKGYVFDCIKEYVRAACGYGDPYLKPADGACRYVEPAKEIAAGMTRLADENEHLRAQLKERIARVSQLLSEYEMEKTDNESLRAQRNETSQELLALKDKNLELHGDNDTLRAEIEQRELTFTQMRDRWTSAGRILDDYKMRLNALTRELTALGIEATWNKESAKWTLTGEGCPGTGNEKDSSASPLSEGQTSPGSSGT